MSSFSVPFISVIAPKQAALKSLEALVLLYVALISISDKFDDGDKVEGRAFEYPEID